MDSVTNIKIKITGLTTDNSENGEVQVAHWDKYQRIKKSLKMWGGCWCLSIISILVPILHFFLVPAFFLAGPIVGLIIYKQESLVLGGSGICPYCKAVLSIEKSRNVFPQNELCTHCRHNVILSLS